MVELAEPSTSISYPNKPQLKAPQDHSPSFQAFVRSTETSDIHSLLEVWRLNSSDRLMLTHYRMTLYSFLQVLPV